VSGIGNVYGYERWANNHSKFLDLFRTDADTINGWVISRASTAQQVTAYRKRQNAHVFTIKGFYGLKDAKVKKIAIGEPRSVPAGQYAQQVLEKLKIWSEIKSKLVFANNVRQVLASVESGNADAGLVYITDAKISDKVKVVVTADEKYHSPIIYPLAVVKRSKNVDAAKEFSQFLSSNQAKTVFKKYGFILP
jgi:molybdate transport system substrate-binding protein